MIIVTHVDAKKNEQNRNHVAAMILPTKEVDSKISFTVVSEPTYDDDDCDELGELLSPADAFVSVEIMRVLSCHC